MSKDFFKNIITHSRILLTFNIDTNDTIIYERITTESRLPTNRVI